MGALPDDSVALDMAGFMLVPHRSCVPLASLGDMSQAEAQQYYSELVEVAQRSLSPKVADKSKAFCNAHVIRREGESGNADDLVMFVHNDFVDTYKNAVLSCFTSDGNGKSCQRGSF